MKEPDYWQQFLNTGRIDDYLNFKQDVEQEDTVPGEKRDAVAAGDNPYAGVCEINGDGFKNSAHRGI